MRSFVFAAPVNPFAVAFGRSIPGVIKRQDFMRNAGVLAGVLRRNKIQQARLARRFGGQTGRHT
jgi:hypothetical protein